MGTPATSSTDSLVFLACYGPLRSPDAEQRTGRLPPRYETAGDEEVNRHRASNRPSPAPWRSLPNHADDERGGEVSDRQLLFTVHDSA
jgi:hypothetical protein